MQKINEHFTCVGCGADIQPATKTCRNHCPYCFVSQHVDGELPGDRESDCHGKMLPSEYVVANGTIKIHYICQLCRKEHWNKVAIDDEIGNLDASIALYKPDLERLANT